MNDSNNTALAETQKAEIKGPEAIEVPADIAQITVEVAYAQENEQVILSLQIEPDTTLEQAIARSGVLARFPEIDLSVNKVGIFGKLGKKTATLKAGDRVEIYRPLIADPKEVRRKREADGKKMQKGGGEK